jgi:large subunit ribosomal protein L13
MTSMTPITHTIDATGKTLGRVATQVATLLMGKDMPSFERNKVSGSKVKLINASKLKISPVKMLSKEYKTYSGYPGGLKSESMKQVVSKKGHKEIVSLAVYGMLPSNKLRSKFMKNLTVTD